MSRQRRGVAMEIILLLALSIVAAIGANALHPKPLPWLQASGERMAEKSQVLSKAGVDSVEPEAALVLWKDQKALFVDAREAAAYVAGRIPGAVNVSLDPSASEDVFTQAERLPKERPLILYCDNMACPKSKELAETLKQLGFTNLTVLVEGLEGWKRVRGPVEMGDKGGQQ